MFNINETLNQIANAVFGREVRQGIHDGVKAAYNKATEALSRVFTFEDRWERVVGELTEDAEVVDTRNSSFTGNHGLLRDRIEADIEMVLDRIGKKTGYSLRHYTDQSMGINPDQSLTAYVYTERIIDSAIEIVQSSEPYVQWTIVDGVSGLSVSTVTNDGHYGRRATVTADSTVPVGTIAILQASWVDPNGKTHYATRPIEVTNVPVSAGQLFSVAGSPTVWRVLLPDDGNGNALIITEHVHGVGTQYNTTNVFRTFQGSSLQTVMNTWYANPINVGTAIRNRAMSYEFQDNNGNSIPRQNIAQATPTNMITAGIEFDFSGNNWLTHAQFNSLPSPILRGITRPIEGTGEVFILSAAEVRFFFGESFVNRRAYRADTLESVIWSLRSSGTDDVHQMRTVALAGNFSSNLAFNSPLVSGHRPAMWVSTDLFQHVNFNPEMPVPPPSLPPVGGNSFWSDSTGFEWIVGARSGNHTLLYSRYGLREDILQASPLQYNNSESRSSMEDNTATNRVVAFNQMQGFWNNNSFVSPELRAASVHASLGNTVTGMSTVPLATPTAGVPDFNRVLFFPTISELNIILGGDTNALRVVRPIFPTGVVSDISVSYWLRTFMDVGWDNELGHIVAQGRVSVSGVVSTGNSRVTRADALRPAVWVNHTNGILTGGIVPASASISDIIANVEFTNHRLSSQQDELQEKGNQIAEQQEIIDKQSEKLLDTQIFKDFIFNELEPSTGIARMTNDAMSVSNEFSEVESIRERFEIFRAARRAEMVLANEVVEVEYEELAEIEETDGDSDG